ncbi:8678_t:CDS:1, partial [Racocetra persica]
HNFENDRPLYESTDYILNNENKVYKDDQSKEALSQNDPDLASNSIY